MKKCKLEVFYQYELINIYKIIENNSIKDKIHEIEKIGSLKKLDKSLSKGFYRGIDKELDTIKNWWNANNKALNHNIEKGNQYSKKQLEKKLIDLVYLYRLYKNGILNENTYYPVFKKIQISKINTAPKFRHLLKSKNIDNEECIEALSNVEVIEHEIEKFHVGLSLKNLRYRREIEETLEKNNFLENYKYAEYLINAYISFKSCYRISDFLLYANIDRERFDDCVRIIEFLNPVLHEQYIEKREIDNKKNILACNAEFKIIAGKIKEYTKLGKEMPPFEFISLAPFLHYYENQQFNRVSYITKVKKIIDDDDILNTICSYLYRNKLDIITYLNPKNKLDDLVSFGTHEITDEDRANIVLIIKRLNLPSTGIVLRTVVTKYFNNEYNLDEISEKRKNNIEEHLEKNPYVYKKVL